MGDELEEGICSAPAIAGCKFVHFAIHNADWHEKTPDGSTFHEMTTNVFGYEQNATEYVSHQMLDQEDGTLVSDATDDVEMIESFDQNHESTDVMVFIVESTTPESNSDLTVHNQDNNSKLDTVCSSFTCPFKGKFGDIPRLRMATPSPIEPHYISHCEWRKA